MAVATVFETTDTSLLTNVLNEAIFTAQEKSIAGGLYTVYNLSGTPGLTAQIPIYPSISASAVTDGSTDISGANTSALTNVTITAANIAARLDVTDLLASSTARNMASDVGVILGNAIAEKIDVDAFSLFTEALIANDVGDNGTTITPDLLLKAVYALRNQNAPTDADGDYLAVLHPGQAYALASALTQAGFASGGSTAISNVGNSLLSSSAYVGRLYNVKIFQSTSIAADSVATDAQGCVFSPMAFGHVLKRPITIETQRDASKLLTEYVISTARGNAVLKANYAVRVKGTKTI
jgi:N4-gp56 family major capsid protein